MPLYYCKLQALITKVWNPCAPLLLFTGGTDHRGVEPLCSFTTVNCRHYLQRCGTPVPLYYCTLWAQITKVWNPCAPLLLCTVCSDPPGVEPLCPFTTVHCRQLSPRCGTPVPLYYCTLWGNNHPGIEPLCPKLLPVAS